MAEQRKRRKTLPASHAHRENELKTWILVARRNKAKLIEHSGFGKQLTVIRSFVNPAGAQPTSALVSDRPGRVYRSAIGMSRHAATRSEEPHEHALSEFARTLASTLEHGLATGTCERFVIAAEPHCLGKIKKNLTPTARKRLAAAVDKDLFLLSTPKLYKELEATLQQ